MREWSIQWVTSLILVGLCGLCWATEPPIVPWGDYQVEVNEYGNLGRIFLERGTGEFDAMLERAEASGVEPNVWKVALIMVPTFDVTWKDYRGNERHTVSKLTPEQMDHIRAAFKKLAQFTIAYTGGHLAFAPAEYVFPEPVVLVTGPKQGNVFFPPVFVKEMAETFPDWKPEEVDSVICVFPPGDMPMYAFGDSWGHSFGKYKAGNAHISYVVERIETGADLAILLQHEWLHQVECVMMLNMGYLGLPNLHDTGICGYTMEDLEQPQWLAWNRDFMFRLYRPAMWQKADMNRRVWSRPEAKYEGSFIRQWLVRGPFPSEAKDRLDVDFLGGEADVLPTAAAGETSFPVEDNAAWHGVDAPALFDPLPEDATEAQHDLRADQEDMVSFYLAFEPKANAVAYAHVYLHAERTEAALLWLGSDEGVKVFLNGLVVHRRRVTRGVTKDMDRVPVILKAGWNRLLVKVDQSVGGWGFCARFSTKDGQPVEGLTVELELPEGKRVATGTAIPVTWDGRLYAWSDVKDDPWAKLPELDETMLRAMTGLDELSLESDSGVLLVDPGDAIAVRSPVLGGIDAGDSRLNNQLTYANESLAWLRYRTATKDARFESSRRDLVFVRWDVIDPWLSWLQGHSKVPPKEALAGYVAVNRQVAYVVYTDLGKDAPGNELGLVSLEDAGIKVAVAPERAESLTAKIVRARLGVENTTAEPVTLKKISVECDAADVEAIVMSPITDERIRPGDALTTLVPVLRVAPEAEPGVKLARVQLDFSTANGPFTIEQWLALRVAQPVGVELLVDGPGIIKSGTSRTATLVLTNNASHLGKVAWKVKGRGVGVKPGSDRFLLQPLPKVSTTELSLTFHKKKRSGFVDLSATLDVAEDTVPDSHGSRRVYVGGKDILLRYDFEKELHGLYPGRGTYSVERVRDRAMHGRGYALIKDGGGGKFGSIVLFGPAEGAQGDWDLAYWSEDYPTLEFTIAPKDTGNTAIIVQADGKWYALIITGELVEQWGSRQEIGNLGLAPDGTVHQISFNLDEALDRVAGEGNHTVQQILIGDTRSFASNYWRGPDVGTIMLDNFTIR